MFTNYCINSIIFKTVFANTCPIQEKKIHVSRLAFFFFFICLGDSQLVSDLVCEGGTLFCLVFDLDLSDSCSIGGTWEELLSESLFDKIIDGTVETAGGRVLTGWLFLMIASAGSLVLIVFKENAFSCFGRTLEVFTGSSSLISFSNSSGSCAGELSSPCFRLLFFFFLGFPEDRAPSPFSLSSSETF